MKCDPRFSVFINVPFDVEYQLLRDTLIFSTVCCGFIPRSALESGSSGTARMHRILGALSTSHYSVHDLTRCRGDGQFDTARFNMPLELGMAIACAYSATYTHEWFALVLRSHSYALYASDLLGYDLKSHTGTPETIVPPYMAWLLTREEAVGDLTPRDVLMALPTFQREKKEQEDKWSGEVPWWHLVQVAAACVPAER